MLDNSSAEENDLRVNDIIISINDSQIYEFSDIPKALGNSKYISILIQRNNELIEKNFELNFNEEINRFVIGISSNIEPVVDKFNLYESIQQSLSFIPTYYSASINFLRQSWLVHCIYTISA